MGELFVKERQLPVSVVSRCWPMRKVQIDVIDGKGEVYFANLFRI
jgi:hypothetical protein